MQKITPFLWFDKEAEEAMKFYTSVFRNSAVMNVMKSGDKVMSVQFRLEDLEFMALNAGPKFKFNESVSFFVSCKRQEEVDYYWEKLSAGGEESMCGWLKDKYGLSWQIIPVALQEMLMDKDPKKSQNVMQAMLKMKKIDIDGLKKAYEKK